MGKQDLAGSYIMKNFWCSDEINHRPFSDGDDLSAIPGIPRK